MNISYLMALQFIVVVIYLNLLIIILYQKPKSRLNYVFASLVACFLWWGIEELFIYNPNISKESVTLIDGIGSIGWIMFPSFFLWFSLIFVKNKVILQKNIFYIIIFLIPIVLIIRQCLVPISMVETSNAYGWNFSWANSAWTYAYFSYYIGFFLLSFYFLYRYFQQAEVRLYKNQVLVIVISTLVSILVGTFSDILLPIFSGSPVPSLGNIFIILWALGMFYAISKHQLLELSFSLASRNIISNISDSLLLLDKNGRIIDANDCAVKFFKFSKKDILKHEFVEYFGKEFSLELKKILAAKKDINDLDAEVLLKDGSSVSVLLSCSGIKDKNNEFLGWVCVISDVSYQKKNEVDLAAKNIELQEEIVELEKFQKIFTDRESRMIELQNEIDRLKK